MYTFYMRESFRILVAVDVALKEPYISITKEGCLETWIPEENSEIGVLIYHSVRPGRIMRKIDALIEKWRWHGGKLRAYAVSYFLMFLLSPFRSFLPRSKSCRHFPGRHFDEIEIKIPEARLTQRWKKLQVIRYFLESTSFDFLLLVTPSCYINKKLLAAKLAEWGDPELLYCGSIQNSHDGPFVAGGTLVMNRRTARLLLDRKNIIPTHTMDDVAFGLAARTLGVPLSEFSFLDIEDASKVESSPLRDHFYVRVAGQKLGERTDVFSLKKVHELLSGEQDK